MNASPVFQTDEKLTDEQCLFLHDHMVKSRLLEERLITMFKNGDGYFWIGGPGEEAFNVSLGMLINKGQGLDHDFLHFHYRSSATLITMGMDPQSAFHQMASNAADPHSGGRSFSSHYSIREWNVLPITSPIEVQYLTAIGTAIAQRDHGGEGITIVTGGDAGSAEGDFASSLIWSSRPGQELPLLILVTNNGWGISTSASTQHGEKYIADRGQAFGMETMVVDGNDVHQSYFALQHAMTYVRTKRKPFLLEARVSRLHGHSSASGANRNTHEIDPLVNFENALLENGMLSAETIAERHQTYREQFAAMAEIAKNTPPPKPESIYDHIYWQQTGRLG